jgi:hypothetical protein
MSPLLGGKDPLEQLMSASLDRRQFSIAAALALLGGATIAIGCGGASSNSNNATPVPSPATGVTGNGNGSVSGNHERPHTAVITAAQLSAGGGLILDISNGLHSHTVTLTGAQVMQIATGGRVAVISSTNPHSDGSGPHDHQVTFN